MGRKQAVDMRRVWLRLLIRDHPPPFCLFFSLLTSLKAAWTSGEPFAGLRFTWWDCFLFSPSGASGPTECTHERRRGLSPFFLIFVCIFPSEIVFHGVVAGNIYCHNSSEVRKQQQQQHTHLPLRLLHVQRLWHGSASGASLAERRGGKKRRSGCFTTAWQIMKPCHS